MTKIKDLKAGDAFTGTVQAAEFDVKDGVVTMSWVEVKGLTGGLEAIDKEIKTLERDIAYRQGTLATRKLMREKLLADAEPAPVEEK